MFALVRVSFMPLMAGHRVVEMSSVSAVHFGSQLQWLRIGLSFAMFGAKAVKLLRIHGHCHPGCDDTFPGACSPSLPFL